MYKARDSDQSQTEEIESKAFELHSIETGVYKLKPSPRHSVQKSMVTGRTKKAKAQAQVASD
jgi:hypothetical protein